jgi:hypothetical protein
MRGKKTSRNNVFLKKIYIFLLIYIYLIVSDMYHTLIDADIAH